MKAWIVKRKELQSRAELLQHEIDALIQELEGDSIQQHDTIPDTTLFVPPEGSTPINANVMMFDWKTFSKTHQFDVIMMDPPWQLAPSAPTRGVALSYSQLPDPCIQSLPIPTLHPPTSGGLLFLWVINAKYAIALEMLEAWGYTLVDDIAWMKLTVNRRMAKGHGYYLQHAKETCLVGYKPGSEPPRWEKGVDSDVVMALRRGQSQKPDEIYAMIERLIPNGRYLEVFGRRNNLRCGWVTIGNEL